MVEINQNMLVITTHRNELSLSKKKGSGCQFGFKTTITTKPIYMLCTSHLKHEDGKIKSKEMNEMVVMMVAQHSEYTKIH